MVRPDLHETPKNKVNDDAGKRNEQDEVIVILVNGINSLIAMANSTHMGMASKILHTAKEELVHWAVNMNFHESAKERFINSQLYSANGALPVVSEFLSKANSESINRLLAAMEHHIRNPSEKQDRKRKDI